MSVQTMSHEDYSNWQRKEHRRQIAVDVMLRLLSGDVGERARWWGNDDMRHRAERAVAQAEALLIALGNDYQP